MKVLFTGKGKSGSWKIRGEQIGAEMGATVCPNAPLSVMRDHDVIVLVKRPTAHLIQDAQASCRLFVWDVVDAWPQPDGNAWDKAKAMAWMRESIAKIRPHALVAATKAMAKDLEEFGLPVLPLPHHYWPKYRPIEVREEFRTLAYEGGDYLGTWEAEIRKACAEIGARFVTNPPDLSAADAVFACRQSTGYPVMHWKSNVKQANAHALGLPFIAHREAGYVENAAGSEVWLESSGTVAGLLSALRNPELRKHFHALALQGRIPLPRICNTYRAWLSGLLKK